MALCLAFDTIINDIDYVVNIFLSIFYIFLLRFVAVSVIMKAVKEVVQMSIANKVKSTVTSQDRKQIDAAAILGISPQAWRNKLSRQSFNIRDLVILASGLGLSLAFVDSNDKAVTRFNLEDLPKNTNE